MQSWRAKYQVKRDGEWEDIEQRELVLHIMREKKRLMKKMELVYELPMTANQISGCLPVLLDRKEIKYNRCGEYSIREKKDGQNK